MYIVQDGGFPDTKLAILHNHFTSVYVYCMYMHQAETGFTSLCMHLIRIYMYMSVYI